MTYSDLNINEKINLKGFFDNFAKYAEKDIKARIIKRKIGISDALYKRIKVRSHLKITDLSADIVIEYLDYGYFTHLGVGKGNRFGDNAVARLTGRGRTRKPWMKALKGTELRVLELYVDKMGLETIDLLKKIPLDKMVLKL